MGQSINYKRELFDLINDLTSISPSIGFECDETSVIVRKCDEERTIPYILTAPIDYFGITETIAFYNYPNFYSFMDMIKDAKLTYNGNVLNIDGATTKINYTLSDEGSIINGPSSIAFNDADYTFVLSRDELDEIVKMKNLVKAKRCIITCDDDVVKLKMYTDETSHSVVKEFVGDNVSDIEDVIKFEVSADRFSHLPPKRDYTVHIKKEKFMKFSLMHDEINLDIYSGSID